MSDKPDNMINQLMNTNDATSILAFSVLTITIIVITIFVYFYYAGSIFTNGII